MAQEKNKMTKFTIIIPTRERCDVLASALKTCLMQDYDNFEIIVSDNFSQDKTKEMVDSFGDNRVRYINTGKRVSMSENWEFALSHINGGYLTYLGDDDGLLPGALFELNEIINRTQTEAIVSKTAGYYWPSHIDVHFRNTLRVPLRDLLVKRDSRKMLMDVINFRRNIQELPMLYRGFASYRAIKRATGGSGKFIHSMNPDHYSGIALACVLESYYYSFKPYAISGASSHSAGAAAGFSGGTNNFASKMFFGEDNMPAHSKVVVALSGPIIVAESFLQAQDHIPGAKQFKMEIKKCLQAALTEVEYTPQKHYEVVVEEVRKVASLNNIDSFAAKLIAKHKKPPARSYKPVLGLNVASGQVVVDCAKFGVKNVYDAALLCRDILVLDKIRYRSLGNIVKTAFSLLKREIVNKNLGSIFFKVR